MAIGSGTRVQLAYVAEVTHGTTPGSPAMLELRNTSRRLNLMKDALETAEVRADREIADARHGFNRVEGEVGFELALQAYDDMLEAALGGAWAAGTNVTSVAAVASGNKFTRASGSWITDGYRAGDIITTAGFAAGADNGDFLVVGPVTATDLPVSSVTIVDETAEVGQTAIQKGKRVQIGTTLKTFTFERGYLDVAQYEVFRGCAINTFGLSIRPEQLILGTLGILGMSAAPLSGSPLDASITAAATESPMSAFDGSLREGGSSIAVVTGLDLTLDNGRTLAGVVGSPTSPDVFEGQADVQGTLTAFFENATLLNKFRNETESSLWMRMNAPNDSSKFLNLVIPRVKYFGGEIDPPQEGPIVVTMPFRGLRDATTGTSLSIQRSNS